VGRPRRDAESPSTEEAGAKSRQRVEARRGSRTTPRGTTGVGSESGATVPGTVVLELGTGEADRRRARGEHRAEWRRSPSEGASTTHRGSRVDGSPPTVPVSHRADRVVCVANGVVPQRPPEARRACRWSVEAPCGSDRPRPLPIRYWANL
jgi:hypothetical protein